MVNQAEVQYHVAPFSVVPRPSTPAGDQKRDEFLATLFTICGDVRLLWLAQLGDTTTSTSKDRDARTITWDATVAARLSALGSGVSQDFNGTSGEGDTPDTANLSFGNGTTDQAFSIVALAKPDVNNANMHLIAKSNSASAQEWELSLDSSGRLVFTLVDESASADIAIRNASAFGTSRALIAATYDGGSVDTGMVIYKNAVLLSPTSVGSGSYTAMEDTAALAHIGARFTTKERFWNGAIDFAVVCAKQLSVHELWAIKAAVNAYYDISL